MSEQQKPTDDTCPTCAGLRAELTHLRILAGSESDWAAFYRSKLAALEAERQALTAALDRTREYIRTAMRPSSVAAACSEGLWERAHRSGLQHALNAIDAEFGKAEAALSASPRPEPAPELDLRVLRQMFSDGVDVARSYGDNAFHLWGEQLERQFQRALARIRAGEFTVQSRPEPAPTKE